MNSQNECVITKRIITTTSQIRSITNINMIEKSHKTLAHSPVFSRTFDEIPLYSRPGIPIIKFQYIPGVSGMRTDPGFRDFLKPVQNMINVFERWCYRRMLRIS